nr:hemerythrin family protein [uncultured Cohaesibacter sp.]
MTLIEWDEDKHLVGVDEMDNLHQAFTLIVNSLGETKDSATFKALFIQLLEHTQEHFAIEDRIMQETGFADHFDHRTEHTRFLAEMNYINDKVQASEMAYGRAFIKDLPRWFHVHSLTMDRALAAHVNRTASDLPSPKIRKQL